MRRILFYAILAKTLLQNVLAEGNAYTRTSEQGLEKEPGHYECDATIEEQFGDIRTPGYPGKYPRYARCKYSVKRFSQDTCEVKLTMDRFEVAKMTFSNCSADFLELQNGHERYKMCGELPPGTKRFVMFPEDSDWLVFKFQSTFHQMWGFSIAVKQLPYSCKKNMNSSMTESMQALPPCVQVVSGRIGRISFPEQTVDDDSPPAEKCTYKIQRSEARACLVQLDFSRFEVTLTAGCESGYLQLPGGQRLCGILGGSRKLIQFPPDSDELVLEFVSSADKSNSFDIHVVQLPGPCEHSSAPNATSQTGRASRQCDQSIRDTTGRITSPGFPSAFGPNYRCTYKIFRPDPSVCHIELDFLTFNLGKHNPPGCPTGSFLELPGRTRLCHDMEGKMLLKVSEFKDPVIFHFQSDSRSSGRGFDIIANQIPNTCPGYGDHSELPGSAKRCYQEVTTHAGYFSSSNIQPQLPMRRPMWCEFVVRRAGPTVCRVKLQISSRSFLNLPCINNFVHLPNGERMCISVTETRELRIPEGSNYVTLVYYNTNNPEFNLFVEQVSNSCKPENRRSHSSRHKRWAWNIFPR